MSASFNYRIAVFILLLGFFAAGFTVSAQTKKIVTGLKDNGVFTKEFIKNIGQYGNEMKGYEGMGKIEYGYEGLGMPVLFTPKGMIHLQRKVENISHREEERMEKLGVPEEEIERKKNITDRVITVEWLHASPAVQIIAAEQKQAYHTYGMLPDKAYGYSTITYKNMYPGIDVLYSFTNNAKTGFEYSLLLQPGADISRVKLRFGGDIRSIKKDSKGNLVIRSDIDGISTSVPVSYYAEKLEHRQLPEIKTEFKISNREISFFFPLGYDSSKAIVIDPFVSSTSNLTGAIAGKAIDVDYDYEGNVYVAGGGGLSQAGNSSHSHAKYNSSGTLLWTFNGVLTIPSWQAGYYFGGWVVDKVTGAIYIGQGFAYEGFRVIRVSTTGLYDNYISTGNPAFQEAWKMYWFCNNGNPQIICAGGGTTGNTNFAICAPPSTTLLSSANLTGSAVAGQDMTDLVIDPVTNSLYTIYASPLDFNTANKIFKNTPPYSAATRVWSTFTGYSNVIQELRNRPYLNAAYNDNGSNILAQNANYIFYWDGLNLKAFDKVTGAAAGTALQLSGNTVLMQGGIVADACDNVYIGNTGGNIKVYKFNGTVFNDVASPDISIPGYTSNVYDLALNESKKLLYASGDGFVASIDIAAYCPNTIYTVNVVPNCATASVTATVSPLPVTGSTITYALFDGATQINSNITGVFTGLNPNITYTVVATINRTCSGTQASASFVLPGPDITASHINSTCGASTGSITVAGSGTPGPYSYSLNGSAFQPSGNFTGLAAGIYNLVVQSNGGCLNDTVITILNSNGPALTYAQTNAICGRNTGTVTANATGGNAPYQYSINGGTTYQSGNFFTGLLAGQYTLVVRDADGCTNRTIITITTSGSVSLTAIPASATCGQANGTITAFGTGGTGALQYSINGNIFQAANVFTNLPAGLHTVYVQDEIGCVSNISVSVGAVSLPAVTASFTPAGCGNNNGTITANGTGGTVPYQFSINGGISYQNGNVFTGLAPGLYTVTIRDAVNCIRTFNITVTATNGPSLTATASASLCTANSGSITATATGGALPYQYSLNGVTYQAGNTFNGLGAGGYIIYVRDVAGCIAVATATVSAITGPNLTATATASACVSNTGTITASGTGGTAPLDYSIDGVTYQAANLFTGLSSGIYTVYVKDANGCIKTVSVTVDNASGLSVSLSAIAAACANNGSVTATASGGVPPLQYSMDGVTYQPANSFTGLAPGAYTIYVKDQNDCVVNGQVTVTSAAGLTLNASVPLQATCGSSNAAILLTGSGGIAPLTYSINGTVYQPSGTFINIAPGNYTVYVKDASGCVVTRTVSVTTSGAGPGISTFTVRTENAYPCNDNVGKIDQFRVNGANCGTCTYSINFGAYLTGIEPIWSSLTPGTYAITARDANGCTRTVFATIGIAVLSSATYTVTGTACNTSNGSITLTGTGPNTPYHASISGIGGPFETFDPNFTFTNLAPGTYEIIIADDEDFNDINDPGNCLDTITVVVPAIGGPAVTAAVTNATCNFASGSITATGTAGTAPYTYNINGGAYTASPVFNNLVPGIYEVGVQDFSGCTNFTSVTIAGTAVPAATVIVQSATCNISNGTITINATGGTAPLEYSTNGTVYQLSNTFSNLAAGTYTVYVKDATGCFSTQTAIITTLPRVTVTAFGIPALCGNNDGGIVAAGTQGAAPYTFSLDGILFQSSNIFTGLAAGFYTVTIKDARGCTNTTGIAVNNSGGPSLTTSGTAATCGNNNASITITATGGAAPLQYSIDGINFQSLNSFTGLAPGNYTVTVKDANGCINTRTLFVSNLNGPHTLNATVVNAACGLNNGSVTASGIGGTGSLQYSINGTNYFASPIFSGLAAGTYTLYVRDANLCVHTRPVIVSNLAGPGLSVSSSPATCGASDGTITATASGGTLALAYSRNGVTFQASNIFTGLAAGTYNITVRDARLCTSVATVTVSSAGGPIASASSTAATCNGGSITITAESGTGPYSYSINGTLYQASNIFTGLAAGTYTVYVRDALLCVSTSSIIIGAPTGTPGIWTGNVDADWFNCSNWQAGTVPTNLIDVLIPASGNKPVIDPLSPFAATYGGIASAKTLTINNDTLIFKLNAQLQVEGNITIQNNGQADMLGGGNINLKGNWINNVGINGFAAGSGRISLTGNTAQSISTTGANETFNELYINHTGTGVALLNNTTVSATMEITQGLVSTGTNTLNGGLLRMTGGTLRLSKNAATLPELSTYNLTGGTVEFNGTGAQTIRPVNYYNLLSSSTGQRVLSALGVTGIAASFTPGTNIYTVTGSAVHFNGTAGQLIPPVITGAAPPYTNQYNILLVSGNNTKTVSGNFTILDSLKVYPGTNFAISSNSITLKSDNNKTARVAAVQGAIANAAAGGNYIVERFIPAHDPPKRAWRFITAPVVSTQSVNTAWQEAAVPSTSGVTPPASAVNHDPNPGFGTHISGPGAAANGFDQTPLNNPSVKFYNSGTNTWNGIPNTSMALTSYPGYMNFVRGNRAYQISTTTNATAPSSTVLRAKGNLKTHAQIFSGSSWQVIGNPYASAINLHNTVKTGGVTDAYYVWDPLIASAPQSNFGVGAYLTILYVPGPGYVTAIDPNLPGPSYHPYDIDGTIQSGAAFFMNFGTGGTLTFNESNKVSGSNNYQFRGQGDPVPQLRAALYVCNADSTATYLTDGVLQLFDASFSNDITLLDLPKAENFSENFSIRSNNQLFSIETRLPVTGTDTLFYDFRNQKLGIYQLKFYATAVCPAGTEGFIEDIYTQRRMQLNTDGETMFNFSVTTDTASQKAGRIRIVFRSNGVVVLPVEQLELSAHKINKAVQLNWMVENETAVSGYDIERAADGLQFNRIGYKTVQPGNTAVKNYAFTDAQPFPGNNYYRLRYVSVNNSIQYSKVVLVSMKEKNSGIVVSPNPLEGNSINLKFTQMPEGKYQVRLFDNSGKLIFHRQVRHTQPNGSYEFDISAVAAELYQLEVTGASGKKVLKLIPAR